MPVFLYRARGARGDLLEGRLEAASPERDRFMICGGPGMLANLREFLNSRGFSASPSRGEPGAYVFERAFVDR